MRHHHIDKEGITALAKKVLIMMSQREVPLYPENYFVWFDYIAGSNRDLAADINRIIEEGGKFTEKINDELYHKYFDADDSLIEDAQKEILSILRDVLDEILYTQDFTSDYRLKLQGFTKQLEEARGMDEIHSIVASLMRVTVEVIKSSEQLKTHLEETTSKSEKLQKELEKAQLEILIDPLTALYNRKAFDRKIAVHMNAFLESGSVFSLVMLDIDHFKQFNDEHGHLLGDQVLKFMGALLTKELKGKDFVARYGGEEFIILMENTSPENAYIVADKIRKSLDGVQLKYVKTGQVLGKITVSAGVAAVKKGDTAESLVKRADDALYFAKRNGRNSVKSERDLPGWREPTETAMPAAVEFLEQ